jgi:CRP-like cAMP-binding protein
LHRTAVEKVEQLMSTRSSMSAALLASDVARRSGKGTPLRTSVALLASVPLFSGLSRRHLRRLATVASETRFGPGRVIVQRGTRGNAFFVIVEGEAKVTVSGSKTAAKLGPGDFFGELAVLDGGPRTASVVAESRVVAIRIMRSDLRKLLRQEPDVAITLLEEVARRLRRQDSTTQ